MGNVKTIKSSSSGHYRNHKKRSGTTKTNQEKSQNTKKPSERKMDSSGKYINKTKCGKSKVLILFFMIIISESITSFSIPKSG